MVHCDGTVCVILGSTPQWLTMISRSRVQLRRVQGSDLEINLVAADTDLLEFVRQIKRNVDDVTNTLMEGDLPLESHDGS